MSDSMFNRFSGTEKKKGLLSRLKTSFNELGREGQARMCRMAAAVGIIVFVVAAMRLVKIFMG